MELIVIRCPLPHELNSPERQGRILPQLENGLEFDLASSFNGRTSASGAGFRGSNPCEAANPSPPLADSFAAQEYL